MAPGCLGAGLRAVSKRSDQLLGSIGLPSNVDAIAHSETVRPRNLPTEKVLTLPATDAHYAGVLNHSARRINPRQDPSDEIPCQRNDQKSSHAAHDARDVNSIAKVAISTYSCKCRMKKGEAYG